MGNQTRRFRFVGDHADTLANGRPVEPGEFVDMTEDDVSDHHNAAMIEDGVLAEIKPEPSGKKEES